ncbi:hypothetical protein PVAND_009951 [Polypedilum vanderplanki]|uniref:Uncharacterized protein n=1 Tax=Polypedilum vanderplanki TaxID=319348 RepID=A0A9J6CF87_POLVA|nr:hypothetical protein PVAND_009951 [Polypedilum vanderplanki]
MDQYEDYKEIDKFLRKCDPAKSTTEAAKFLMKLMSSGHIYSTSKYRTALLYFINNFFDQLWEDNQLDLIKEMLQYKFPYNSIDSECLDEVLKRLKTLMKKEKSIASVEISMIVIFNESFKEFFKKNLKKYSKLVGQSLGIYNLHIAKDNTNILDDFIQELYYFARIPQFRECFLEHILIKLHEVAINDAYDNIKNMWDLTNTILFKRSLMNDEEFNASIQSFYEEVGKFDNQVLTEAFIVNFKDNTSKIASFIKHYVSTVLLKDYDSNSEFFNHAEILFSILKKHNIETSVLKSIEPSIFDEISTKIIEFEKKVDKNDLGNYFRILSLLIACDPHLFVNEIYNIAVSNMLKEKSKDDMVKFENLLSTIIRIFGKDIYQFLRKLIRALNNKLQDNFELFKKRKRKITGSSDSPVAKKSKMINGLSKDSDTKNDLNVWPGVTKEILDEIFADINVNQTTKLWQFFNNELEKLIDDLSGSMDEKVVFKICFIADLYCQMFNTTRIHEHLVYKRSEISEAIEQFNTIQHKFYETIIKIEYNNHVMSSFLKMSYDYENFLMLYFYHHDENIKSELDSVFITNNSRIKSSEWKIIQQRIKNFGKLEEKNYSNLLMIQHLLKSNVYKINETEGDRNFLHSLLTDKEQLTLLMEQKDTRLLIFNILNADDSLKNLIEYLYLHMSDDTEKLSFVLTIIRNDPKMLGCFIQILLKLTKDGDTNFSKLLNILDELPITLLSIENKKLIIEKLLINIDAVQIDQHNNFVTIIEKLVKNDGYKGFLKDFSLEDVIKKIRNVKTYDKFYNTIIRNSFKKLTSEGMKSFELILSNNLKVDLLDICAKVVSEINMIPTSECSAEVINKLKVNLITKLLSQITVNNIVSKQQQFYIFSKLCGQNMSILSEDIKTQHMKLLSNLLKLTAKSQPSNESIHLFIMTLKDAKKLNLNDEIKGNIVKALTKYLKNMINDKISQETCDDVAKEKEIIEAISAFKNNCREIVSEFLLNALKERDVVKNQKIYTFKICEILFEVCEKPGQKYTLNTKNYKQICDKLTLMNDITDVDLLCAIFNAHTAMLKCNKENLEVYIIDSAFSFYIDTRNRPSSSCYKDFCKFNETVGQFLFVAANNHHKYFKSRIPQYFKAYTKFLNEIYFYKAEAKEDFELKEISMLLRLTLQLENIIKMLMKLHCVSLVIIAPYIMSSITNVFVKNPKMLTVGDKFKVNIKNISYQLLSTFDDRARKHTYAASDELARDVYENLFAELKRRG